MVLERSLYYLCLCADFGDDGYAGTATLGTDAVSESNLGTDAGWGAITGDCGVNSDGGVG